MTEKLMSDAEKVSVSDEDLERALRLVKLMKSSENAGGSEAVAASRVSNDSMPSEEKSRELDLKSIAVALLRRWWLIVLCTFLGAVIMALVTLLTYTPTYSASGKMYVNNMVSTDSAEKITSSDLIASVELVDTYSEILKTHLTLDVVSAELEAEYGYRIEYEQLLKEISCGSVNNTEVFFIKATDEDPEHAKQIVNKIIDVLPDRIKAVRDVSSVTTVDRAVDAPRVGSGVVMKTFIGAVIGCLLACLYAFIVGCILNDVIDNDNWLRENYGNLPILAEVPNANQHSGRRYGRYGGYGTYGHYGYATEYDTDAVGKGKNTASSGKEEK